MMTSHTVHIEHHPDTMAQLLELLPIEVLHNIAGDLGVERGDKNVTIGRLIASGIPFTISAKVEVKPPFCAHINRTPINQTRERCLDCGHCWED